jgi:hypothetical protein
MSCVRPVTFDVALELAGPKQLTRFGASGTGTSVPVPKTAVDEDYCLALFDNKIGRTG